MKGQYALTPPPRLIDLISRTLLIFIFLYLIVACSSSDGNGESAKTQLVGGELILTINGPGYLVLKHTSGMIFYRRIATFTIDDDGFIVSERGDRLQGNSANVSGLTITGSPVDLQVMSVNGGLVTINEAGLIYSDDGKQQTTFGQVVLADFASSYQLDEFEPGAFFETTASGVATVGAPSLGRPGILSVGSSEVPPLNNTLVLSASSTEYFVLNAGGVAPASPVVYASELLSFNDLQGVLTDEFGNQLQAYRESNGFAVAGSEVIDLGNIDSVRWRSGTLAPKPTARVILYSNLNAADTPPPGIPFADNDPGTYNFSQDVDIYDSRGQQNTLSLYFILDDSNKWRLYYLFNPFESLPSCPDRQLGGPYVIDFDTLGQLITHPAVLQTDSLQLCNGADIVGIDLDISGLTQRVEAYQQFAEQDGYASGIAVKLEVEDCGRLVVSYSNTIETVIGQLVLASFPDASRLEQNSEGLLLETNASGVPALGVPCIGGFEGLDGDNIN